MQAPCTPAWTPRAWDLPLLLLPQRPALSAHLRDRSSANILLENRPWPCDSQARAGLLRCTLAGACTPSRSHKRTHAPARSQHQRRCHHRRAWGAPTAQHSVHRRGKQLQSWARGAAWRVGAVVGLLSGAEGRGSSSGAGSVWPRAPLCSLTATQGPGLGQTFLPPSLPPWLLALRWGVLSQLGNP